MIITRNGETFSEIIPLTIGQAPDFSLKDQHDNIVTLSKLASPIIVSVFPDINTSVCSVQTRRFNQEAAAHKDIAFLSISNNTQEEQANWCAAEGVEMTILSDVQNEFGQLYGIVMTEVNLLARSVFVIKGEQIIYAEILAEITDEPDYEKALQVVGAAI
ncbi:peroxiredoxin [Pseudolactococcus yaeyamensis]